ncbi:MAG TPA: hypothetical protein VL202_13585 [Pararhizobium sp.]|uniref:hypothetical protein n=1 Tax=Pararhizobium sp. TaxID=1977563 RepID=UPI002BBCBEF4|nr:hypothetical protein [Pararhizobium sp.]HTO32193.1 hypothetical protein [Pararhizobium sp.]
MTEPRLKPRQKRGEPYSLEEFRRKYDLSEEEARTLHERFGPSSIELDLLMLAKGKPPVQ